MTRDPTTYAMTAVNMGDRPSATIAQVALRKTAQDVIGEYPTAAKIIMRNSYMDDIPASVDNDKEAFRCMSNIEEILNMKGFSIKE